MWTSRPGGTTLCAACPLSWTWRRFWRDAWPWSSAIPAPALTPTPTTPNSGRRVARDAAPPRVASPRPRTHLPRTCRSPRCPRNPRVLPETPSSHRARPSPSPSRPSATTRSPRTVLPTRYGSRRRRLSCYRSSGRRL